MNIQVFELVTGNYIIGDVEDGAGDKYRVLKPYLIMITPQRIGLAEYPLLPIKREESITLIYNHIIGVWKPEIELENAYLQQTSGIKLATNLGPDFQS